MIAGQHYSTTEIQGGTDSWTRGRPKVDRIDYTPLYESVGVPSGCRLGLTGWCRMGKHDNCGQASYVRVHDPADCAGGHDYRCPCDCHVGPREGMLW